MTDDKLTRSPHPLEAEVCRQCDLPFDKCECGYRDNGDGYKDEGDPGA